MNKRKKIISTILISSFALGIQLLSPFQSTLNSVAKAATISEVEMKHKEAIGINVSYRTQEEIKQYVKENGATLSDKVIWDENPSVSAPYSLGKLSQKSQQAAINMVNQIRFIAGLDYNIKSNDEYIKKAQAASVVNYAQGYLSHYPSKPSGMDDSLYQTGAMGASSSNIAMGYTNLNQSIVEGYMYDGDDGNITMVGHRRWILNPTMAKTGFGATEQYSAMYAFDDGNYSASQYGVAWPAQNMPRDYFDETYPWSISLGTEVTEDNVQVVLTRVRDNKTWRFSNKSSDGYFNVNNDGYGQKGCIIFRPDDIEAYEAGDVFEVNITGLSTPVVYQVSFFDLVEAKSIEIKDTMKKVEIDCAADINVIINPSNVTDDRIVYKSSNEKVASVSQQGYLTGLGYGKAKITATHVSSGLTTSYTITVIPEQVQLYSISSFSNNELYVNYWPDKSVTGYEVVCATDKNFTKNKKTKKSSSRAVTIPGLKNNTTYYVKVRSYYEKNGTKYYSTYSKVEKVKTK